MNNRKNLPLLIGFSLPVLMIVFVALSLYLPGLFSRPKYDFLYVTNGDYYSLKTYSVKSGHVTESHKSPSPYPSIQPVVEPQLYFHDIETNTSRQVSFGEAASLELLTDNQSPDGYKIENGSDSGGFFPFFWSRSNYTERYIVGHSMSRKLNIRSGTGSSYNNFQFLGWVTP